MVEHYSHSRQACRRPLLVAVLAAAVLILASCEIVTGILSWSVFPSFLSGVEATRNLTQELKDLVPEGENEFGCRIAALRSPSYGDVDYIFLLVNTPRGSRLLVLDRNLEIINTVDDGNFGERMMVDADGSFIVGKVRLYGADDPVPDELTISDGDTYKPGVAAGGRNCLLYAGGDTLNMEAYTPAWAGANTYAYPIGSLGGNWNVAGVGYDGDPSRAGKEVMLGLFRWDMETLTVLFVDDTDFATGGLATPIEETYVALGQGFTRTLQAVRRVHYTRNGIVVRTEEDDEQCYLLDYYGQELHRFQLKMRGGVEEAYDVEGEHFYYFSRDQRVLFKGRTGW